MNIGEREHYERNEPDSAATGNVAITTVDDWLFLRQALVCRRVTSRERLLRGFVYGLVFGRPNLCFGLQPVVEF
jgi:hypothetical protein